MDIKASPIILLWERNIAVSYTHLDVYKRQAVEIALVGADALGLHGPDGRPLVLSGYLLYTLTLIAAVVDAAIQTLLGKLCVAQVSPCLPPCFQCFRAAPVGGGDSVDVYKRQGKKSRSFTRYWKIY